MPLIPSVNCLQLIKSHEGLRLHPYLDTKGVPTIGWGCTMYKTGKKVAMSDPLITPAIADDLLNWHVTLKSSAVNGLKILFNQNQFDALVDFAYNVGVGNMSGSTLIKKARVNSFDPSIRQEFMKWIYADGKVVQDLISRRAEDSKLYFTSLNQNTL